MTRKDFVKTSTLAGLAGMISPAFLNASQYTSENLGMLEQMGIQLFSLPRLMEQDAKAALELLAGMGYSELELFGPYPFSAESNKEEWGRISTYLGFSGSGYFGLSQAEFADTARGLGFRIPSLHTDLDTLQTKMPELAGAARSLGANYVTLPSIPEHLRTSPDDYKRMAETFNRIGDSAAAEGIRFAYHNHGYGLQRTEGEVPFEVLMEATNAETVFLEMDIFWTIAGKADPVSYLKKYQGRYKMLHLKDMAKITHFSGDGGTADQWMELFPQMTDAGSGEIDLESIITTARATGVEHYFVEQDLVREPGVALQKSYNYLNQL
jgi:sugar phosphate isomerase/epimerase